MKTTDHSWEDLRLVHAIAMGRGLSGAARVLGLHHATVLRRLNAFEYRMGIVLFDRQPSGYVPTETGEELARIAAEIGEDVDSAYRKLAGQDLRLSGSIRLATSDFLAQTLLVPVFRAFRTRYPSIEFETAISPQFASLTKRDADVALRAVSAVPDHLVGRRIATLGYGVYGRKDLVAERRGVGPEQFDWIGDDHTISHVTTNIWRQESFPNARVKMRYDSLIGKHTAIRIGMGVGFLPHFLGASTPGLTCISIKPGDWTLELWVLTHPDLSRMSRVQAFMNMAETVLGEMNLDDVDEHSKLSDPNWI
ncbi:MAG: LysR family transcriptional regulator [Paracoccaceae bacterium]